MNNADKHYEVEIDDPINVDSRSNSLSVSSSASWPGVEADESQRLLLGPDPWAYSSPPLDVEAHEIRLLQIFPADHEHDALKLCLIIQSLDHDPTYEALSYTWGPSRSGKEVIINGRTSAVTDNLAAALVRLRRTDRLRLIWIDALCINQADLVERGQQVELMTKIYSKASCVIVWLGDSHVSWISNDPPSEPRAFDSYQESLLSDHKLRSLQYTLENSSPKWWDRVWILQEVIVATSDPVFMFGQYTISWQELERMLGVDNKKVVDDTVSRAPTGPWSGFMSLIDSSDEEESDMSDYGLAAGLRFIRQLKRSYLSSNITLLGCLDLTQRSDATDFRDKIYSLLGFCSKDIQRVLQPNYTVSHADVFERAFTAATWEMQDFRVWKVFCARKQWSMFVTSRPGATEVNQSAHPRWIETLCRGPLSQLRRLPVIDDWESWIMRNSTWKPEIETTWSPDFHPTILSDGVSGWQVSGLCIDNIQAISTLQPREKSSTEYDLIANVRLINSLAHSIARIHNRDIHLTPHATSCPDTVAINLQQHMSSDEEQLYRKGTTAELEKTLKLVHESGTDDALQDLELPYWDVNSGRNGLDLWLSVLLGDTVDHRRLKPELDKRYRNFFCTASGLLGIAPEGVAQGDVIAIADKTFVTVVLRPEGDHHRFICYCFVPEVSRMDIKSIEPRVFYIVP